MTDVDSSRPSTAPSPSRDLAVGDVEEMRALAQREALQQHLGEVLGAVHRPARALELTVDTFIDHASDFAQVALHTHQGWMSVGRTDGHDLVGERDRPIGRRQTEAIRDVLARQAPEHWLLPPDTPEREVMLTHLLGESPLVPQLADLGATSLLSLPLVARGRAIGLLTIARARGADFSGADVTFLEDVAQRLAVALDVTIVVADNRHAATTLRTALLPPPLPASSGLDVASYNRVAQEEVTVGGDFIDLHGHDDDLTLLLGDAVGKGVGAAVAAKRIRTSVRTAALVDRSPEHVLTLTNQVLVHEAESPIESFATAVCGRLRRRDGGAFEVTLSNAGHPPPIILRREGTLEYVESHGPALGVFEDAVFGRSKHLLEPGDTLICYTDGITEARGRVEMFGEDGIATALAGLGGAPSSAVVERLAMSVSSFVGTDSLDRDDAAILALQPTLRG
ncbi:MAG TPA: SpoIIE family protein phosphatase [Nocardioides sp.]